MSLQPDPAAGQAPGGKDQTAVTVTEPGVIDGMPDDVYHGDPVPGGSLSHSGLKTILDVPARFRHQQLHGRPHKRAYDLGHAVHAEVLGIGAPVQIIEARDYKTKAAQEERDAAYAAGEVPILRREWVQVQGMVEALRVHHTAGRLFVPGRGHAERSVFWYDDEFGIWRRARFDWSLRLPDGRFAMVDYKSVGKGTVSPGSIARKLYDFGYYTQDVYYSDGAEAVELGDDPAFLFVFQETEPPYLVTVAQASVEARQWARLKIRQGLDLYARCRAANHWPDYAPDVIEVGLPRYAEYDLEAQWRAGMLTVEDVA